MTRDPMVCSEMDSKALARDERGKKALYIEQRSSERKERGRKAREI
jgi:hypothetical protein